MVSGPRSESSTRGASPAGEESLTNQICEYAVGTRKRAVFFDVDFTLIFPGPALQAEGGQQVFVQFEPHGVIARDGRVADPGGVTVFGALELATPAITLAVIALLWMPAMVALSMIVLRAATLPAAGRLPA